MQELRYYLEMLLDHQCKSSAGPCAECRALQRVYDFMETEIFSTVIYNETPLAVVPPLRRKAASAAGNTHLRLSN